MREDVASESTLRDNLLALPVWALLITFGLLAVGVGVGFTLLLAPGLSDSLRGAGGQLIVVSLPVLALVVGLVGASWARTSRIDAMVGAYLRRTVGDKLRDYLVGPRDRDDRRLDPYPPIFASMRRSYRSEIASYCVFEFVDATGRQFDVVVKSNVFNFEVSLRLDLAVPPAGFQPNPREQSYGVGALEHWSEAAADPLVGIVASTIHGSLAEGYTVYVSAEPQAGGRLRVVYRLRQKLRTNFLTSPYLRRYFSEDAAIATYFFFAEALSDPALAVLGGQL